ncbi:hypothetical protein KKG90_11495 [Candidatus Bipolaricaulota bacterium]|nr:hypothetical protein [Candidatus Bipolaricaulota bacterium]
MGDVEASDWSRDGLTLRARFSIPSQLPAEPYPLTVTFLGRDGESVTFNHSIQIQ